MPSYPDVTAPPWIEGDSIRETMLQFFEDPADKEALRQVGRLLYRLSTEEIHDLGYESSVTRDELRAVAADLRYTGGYLFHVIGRSAEWCSLDAADEKLAR